MTRDEVKAIVREVFAEEARLYADKEDQLVLKAVSAILTGFGINDDDRKDIRSDLIHLRRWRLATEQVQQTGFRVVITAIAAGLLGALWLGIKITLGK